MEKQKLIKLLIGIIIVASLPLMLFLAKHVQDNRTHAAAPDQLETEGGVLSSTGVTKQSDVNASGGQYTLFNQSTGASPTPTGGIFPPDRTLSFVATPSIPRPAYFSPIADATWGTKIVRVSNTAGVRHAYSRIPAWNSDQTKILLGFGFPGRMIDGTTYAPLPWFTNGGNQVSMAIWANTDPNKLYGQSGNSLVSQNATTGVITTIHTFSGYTNISLGEYEGGIDDTDTYVALIGTTSGGAKRLITYNIKTNTVLADIVAPTGISDAQISRKGNYVTSAADAGILRYPRDLSSSTVLQSNYSHGDNALDASGNEIYVTNNGSGGTPTAYLLSSGAKTILFPGLGYTIFQAGHVSGHHNRNGWVYLSNYDPSFYGTNQQLPGKDQVVAVKTDGSGTVEVFGFAHHSNLSYESEPQANASRDGTRVIFASEWGGTEIYAYILSH